jgi:hypothetical protein
MSGSTDPYNLLNIKVVRYIISTDVQEFRVIYNSKPLLDVKWLHVFQ